MWSPTFTYGGSPRTRNTGATIQYLIAKVNVLKYFAFLKQFPPGLVGMGGGLAGLNINIPGTRADR